MKILLIPNMNRDSAVSCARKVIGRLNQLGVAIYILEEHAAAFSDTSAVPMSFEEAAPLSDVVVAVGGDGTILHAAKSAVAFHKPVLGINAGRVGFLAQLEDKEEDLALLTNLSWGRYSLENRMMIQATHHRKKGDRQYYAINDVVLSRGELARIIDIEVTCNSQVVYDYRADGVILSTPTGSTAYSMSAGGPVADHALDMLILTPIAPHSLFSRSILFSPDKQLEIRTRQINNSAKFYMIVDGEEAIRIDDGEYISVRRAERSVQFVVLKKKEFYEILNRKMIGRG